MSVHQVSALIEVLPLKLGTNPRRAQSHPLITGVRIWAAQRSAQPPHPQQPVIAHAERKLLP